MLRPSAFILRRERVAVNRQSPKQPTGERAGRENTEEFRVGSHGDSGNSPVSPCLRPTARRILRVLEAVQSFTTAS